MINISAGLVLLWTMREESVPDLSPGLYMAVISLYFHMVFHMAVISLYLHMVFPPCVSVQIPSSYKDTILDYSPP